MARRVRRRHRLPARRADRQLVRRRGRRRPRTRLRLPLGARRRDGAGRRRRTQRRGGRGHGRRPTGARLRRALPAEQVPRGRDARPRRADRRDRHLARCRRGASARVREAEGQEGRPRPPEQLRGGSVLRRDLRAERRGGPHLPDVGLHPEQRRPERHAELHVHLEPLRPSRLPGAVRRPGLRRPEEDGQERRGRDRPDPRPARGRLHLPLSRRLVRPGGQPDRRPAGARAQPLRVLDRRRAPGAGQHVLRRGGGGIRQVGEDREVRARRAGPARRRPRGLALPGAAAALMATTQKRSAKQTALYPLDWLEERSGIVGGVRYFLFRKVPGDTDWWQTLGSATLTAFLVQLVTGVVLAFYYKPDVNSAHASIAHITNDVWGGWLLRGMHRWGASVFIILLFMHMGRVFLFGAYKYPRELNWIVGVLLLATGLFEGLTGYLLPWDQTAYWATVVAININANAPIVGPYLGEFLRGGAEIGNDTLARFYSLHMLVIPGGLFALIGLHLYLVVRLGITAPPWTKAAAGYEEVQDGRPLRQGLVDPKPRCNGAIAPRRPEA